MVRRDKYSIPQNDPSPERAAGVAALRQRYGYNTGLGFPIAERTYDEDDPALSWRIKLLGTLEKLRVNLRVLKARGRWRFVNELPPLAPVKLARMIRSNDFPGLVDYFMPVPAGVSDSDRDRRLRDFRGIFAVAPVPSVAERFQTDEYFAEVMVAGPDPTRLARLVGVPDKFPITDDHLRSVPELAGETLEAALADGRIYWVDHESMAALDNGAHPQAPKFMYSPMVAFCVPRAGGLMRPFAIQCGQDPVDREIYTPADGYSWKLARNCVLAAHNTYQEVLSHLGFTHLMSEPIMLATVRNLARIHPVAVLLRRHLEGTLHINKLAIELLLQPGRAVEYLIGLDLKSTYAWLAEHRAKRSFRDNYLPRYLTRAGTAGAAELPVFPYRDDGMLLWDTIHRWTVGFANAYYRSDDDIQADRELQAWAAEIASPDFGSVRDFGATPGHVRDREDLAEILTMIIWTAGPQHAAVNFAQEEHMTFMPANPLAGYTPEPKGRQHTEEDWLANLPPLDVGVQQYCIMTLLGSIHHTSFGEYAGDFHDTVVADAHARFVDDLTSIEDVILARNRRRPIRYERLLPSKIPNSTNI